MEEVAATCRARSSFGDLAFSALAAGLGLVLLVATGWHLFGASSVDQPDRTLASLSAIADVPTSRRATAAGVQAAGSPSLRVRNVAPAQPVRAQAVSLPRGFVRPGAPPVTSLKPSARLATSLKPTALPTTLLKPSPRLATSLKPAARPTTLLKPGAPPKSSILSAGPRRATIKAAVPLLASRGLVRASRPLPTVGVRDTVSSKAQPRTQAIARIAPAAAASRPRELPARVARLVTSRPHLAPAPASIGARRLSLISAPAQMSARGGRIAERARTLHRSAAARAPSIIEPPLGYDAQPSLVLVSGAAQLELGETAIPTIRSKRRH